MSTTSNITTMTTLANGKIFLSVECLIVIDRSVYDLFQNLYGYIDQSLLINYIKLYYSQVINQVFIITFKAICAFFTTEECIFLKRSTKDYRIHSIMIVI